MNTGFKQPQKWNNDAGRNKRTVWTVPTQPFPQAHFATFPEALIEPCIKAGCPKGGLVLDPFVGTGTTLAVAHKLGCRWIGFELNPEYCELIEKRMRPLVAQGALWDPVDEGE